MFNFMKMNFVLLVQLKFSDQGTSKLLLLWWPFVLFLSIQSLVFQIVKCRTMHKNWKFQGRIFKGWEFLFTTVKNQSQQLNVRVSYGTEA